MKTRSNNASAPYLCRTKVGNLPNGLADIKEHHVNDLLQYWRYMERKYSRISYMNVIDRATNTQITSYTTLFRPTGAKPTKDDLARFVQFKQKFQFNGNTSNK